MIRLSFLLLIHAITFSTSFGQKNQIPRLNYNDTAYIKIIACQITDTIHFSAKYCSAVPFRGCTFKNIEISKPGVYSVSFNCTKPGMCYFLDKDFQIFLIPDDTVTVEVKTVFNENNEPDYFYQATDIINNYFQSKKDRLGYYSFYRNNLIWQFDYEPFSLIDYRNACHHIDSLINQNIDSLMSYHMPLPGWFVEVEKNNIRYSGEIYKMIYLRKLPDELQNKPAFSGVKLKNPNAILSENYYEYLSEYLYYKSPDTLENNDLIAKLINKFEVQKQLIDSLLEGEMRDYYITCNTSDLYSHSENINQIKKVDEFITKNFTGLSDNQLKFIKSEKTRKMQFIKTNLQKGNKAPNFYLKDDYGNPFNLGSFAGKYVYLHFWATWCGPCIKEIPNINKLHFNLTDKKVEIVNICLDNNPEKWKQIIEKENLKGINLICAGNWEKVLKNNYFIEEIPHYSLIDKDGLLISNDCAGPIDFYGELEILTGEK